MNDTPQMGDVFYSIMCLDLFRAEQRHRLRPYWLELLLSRIIA